jgi:hypothetical protein
MQSIDGQHTHTHTPYRQKITKVEQYVTSIKTLIIAIVLQWINWFTGAMGFITLADVTGFFTMCAAGFAAINGLALLIKNMRRNRRESDSDVVRDDTNHGGTNHGGDPADKI